MLKISKLLIRQSNISMIHDTLKVLRLCLKTACQCGKREKR